MSRLPTRRSLRQNVDSFGLSFNAVTRIGEIQPKMPLKDAVRRMTKFLLAAESREESRWLKEGTSVLQGHFHMPATLIGSKLFSFNMPWGMYTPDFSYILDDGTTVHVEVKASKFQSNYRDARTKLSATATLVWFHTFVEVRPLPASEGGGWIFEEIHVNEKYRTDLQDLFSLIQEEQTQ